MKRQRILGRHYLLGLALVCLLLSGCAAGTVSGGVSQSPAPGRIELLLVKAGFETIPDEHPLCAGVCQKLTPGQITPYKKGNKTLYGYLSPETQRMYVGNEGDYQRFINLAVSQNIEERYRPMASESNDPQFWQMWQDLYGGH